MRLFDQRALGFSIFLHALLIVLLTIKNPWISNNDSWNEASKALQTRTLSENDFKLLQKMQKTQKTEQIVQSDDLKSDPNLVAPLSQKVFKSQAKNVVDQNTRAGRVGIFKNVREEGITSPQQKSDRRPASAEEKSEQLVQNLFNLPMEAAPTKEGTAGGRKTASIPSPEKSGQGFSATNDYLPDVAIGANTLLNTQEFKYYSFYERIRQKLSFQWESRLKTGFESLISQGVRQISGDRITRLRVFLKPDGSLLRADLLGTSGYHELDRAALEAFRAAAPFPNPPSGLLAGNQELAIEWSFVVMTAEDAGVRLSVRRGNADYQ